MPEFTLQQLEEFRLRQELAAIDEHVGRYNRNLAEEIKASEAKTRWRTELSRKAGKASGKSRNKKNIKPFQKKS